MSNERDERAPDQSSGVSDNAASKGRREALIKLGKYAAYATPIVIASVSTAHAFPVSGAPPP
jgi:hypothetical protein